MQGLDYTNCKHIKSFRGKIDSECIPCLGIRNYLNYTSWFCKIHKLVFIYNKVAAAPMKVFWVLKIKKNIIFSLFGVFVLLEKFSLIWRRQHCRWRTAHFDLYSALMSIEQWGFFSVPHVLWHRASVHNGHRRGPVTLTIVADRLALELSLPVLMTKVCHSWDSNPQPSAALLPRLSLKCHNLFGRVI